MKKVGFILSTLVSAVAIAQESSPIDLAPASDAVSSISNSTREFITGPLLDVLTVVVFAFLVIQLVLLAWTLVKGATRKFSNY